MAALPGNNPAAIRELRSSHRARPRGAYFLMQLPIAVTWQTPGCSAVQASVLLRQFSSC